MNVKNILLKALLTAFIFAMLVPAFANGPVNISINLKRATLVEIFDRITRQTGVNIHYGEYILKNETTYDVFFRNQSLSAALKDLGGRAAFDFVIEGNNVIISHPGQSSGENRLNEDRKIGGRVLDVRTNEPLIGATISLRGTNIGTITDTEGRFHLVIPDNSGTRLLISYIGYESEEIALDAKTVLNITLKPDTKTLGEVVVVGYGTQSRDEVSGSIASVKAKDLSDQPITSFEQGLAGRIPGVDVSQVGGAPGSGVSVNIRGNSSISFGNSPLIVVDGVPLSYSVHDSYSQGESTTGRFDAYLVNPLSSINPNDIESIEILKDAASAAIYGSRGSNGVVLITTKKGSLGKRPEVSLDMYMGIQKVANKVDVLDAYELAAYSKKARDQSWIAKNPATNSAGDPNEVRTNTQDRYAPYFIPYLNGEQGLTNTDWQDEVFRTAPIQNYDVSVRGGSDKTRYYLSGNYFNQQGIVLSSGVERYGARFNLETELGKKVRVGMNFNPTYTKNDLVQTEGEWFKEGVIISALMYHPNLKARNESGNLILGEMIKTRNSGASDIARIENPVALAELVDHTLDHTRMMGNAFAEIDLLKGLTFRSSFGVDVNFMDKFYYRPKVLNHYNEVAPTKNMNLAWTQSSNAFNWLSENTLTYSASAGQHNFNILLGYTAQKETNARTYLQGTNFPNDNRTTLNAAQATTGHTSKREWSLLSYLGRVEYNFKRKYLLSTSVRRDGSSRFGKDSKWGLFPSVSAGWRISDEPFWPQNGRSGDLKIRASYGLTGNAEIPFYGGTALLSERNYVFGNEVTSGLSPSTSPNTNLSWETTKTFDFGVDLSWFDRKLLLTFDYYNSNTEDLLLNVVVPSSTGFSSSLQNIGEVNNRGLELTLGTEQHFGSLNWTGSFNVSGNQNKVTALGPGQDQILYSSGLSDPAFIVRVGEPIGSFYGYNVLGVFTTQEQFDATPHLTGQNQGVGDFIYEDTDGDGDVDPDDRTVLGNAFPRLTWGFNSALKFRGFDLSFNLIGKHGVERFNAMHRYLAEAWGNNLSAYLDEDAPRPVWGIGTNSHTRPSSWHVEDASFIRLRNITFGYTIPEKLISRSPLSGLRLYLSGLNVFTLTGYSGYNPEVSNSRQTVTAGEEFGNYPVSKSFTIGLRATF